MYVHRANIKLASRPFIGESELMDQERMKMVVFSSTCQCFEFPSMPWCCWLGDRKHIWLVKNLCQLSLKLLSGLLPILESPWIFSRFSRPWKSLKRDKVRTICLFSRTWKSSNLCQKVIEFGFLIQCARMYTVTVLLTFWRLPIIIGFNDSYLHIWCIYLVTVSDYSIFVLVVEGHTLHAKLLNVNWTCVYMLIKMLFWVNAVVLEYRKCCPWKSLKSPWIWFVHLGKNPALFQNRQRKKVKETSGWPLQKVAIKWCVRGCGMSQTMFKCCS